MSEYLSLANQALMTENALNQLALLYHGGYTPHISEIINRLIHVHRNLITAREYDHPMLSREEAINRAQADIDLITKALQQALIYDIKTSHGDWVAMA